MISDLHNAKSAAEIALDHRDFQAAVAAASILVDAAEPLSLDGLSMRALALEAWAEGPSDRLASAVCDWRSFIEIAPGTLPHLALARLLLKIGERDSGFENLLEAERLGPTPEVLLGFAHFYRTASPPDISKAKAYYFRAALRGRTQGMRGYSEVTFEQGQVLSSIAMALIGLMVTPVLALVLGERRHVGFWWTEIKRK